MQVDKAKKEKRGVSAGQRSSEVLGAQRAKMQQTHAVRYRHIYL